MDNIQLPNRDSAFIEKLIPQRNPIIMVDAIYQHELNKVVGGLTIKTSSIFVNQDEMKESGILEHMAQTVALYTGYHFYINKQEAPTGYIGSMKGIEIFRYPKVGENLKTEVEILHEIMGVSLVKIETKIDNEIIAKGEMKTVIAEY